MTSSTPPAKPSQEEKLSILFVCLGNICRSPMAEGIFRSLITTPPYNNLIATVDSCGTGAYHTGDGPDPRTMSTLSSHGIKDYVHRARKVKTSDFEDFDYIFAMDEMNLRDLKARSSKGKGKARVLLFGEFSGRKDGEGEGEVVGDPYYGARDGFEVAFEQCSRFSRNFLDKVLEGRGG